MMEIDLQFHILTLNRSRDGKLLKLEDKEGLGQHIRYWNGKSLTCFYATTNKFNALAEDIFYQVGKRNVDTSRDMYVEKRQLASIMSGVLDRHKREEENEIDRGEQVARTRKREGVSGHHYFCFKIGEIERLM